MLELKCECCGDKIKKEKQKDYTLYKCTNPKCGHFYTVSDLSKYENK